MENSSFLLKLKSIMLDNKFDRVVRNRKRGKLDDKSLYKVALNRNNVFKKKVERAGKEYNIVICVDQSGSMHCNRKMETASELSEFLVKTFEKVGNVNVSLVGFSSILVDLKSLNKKLDRDFMKTGSLEKLIYHISNCDYIHKEDIDDYGCNKYHLTDDYKYFIKLDNKNKDKWGARPNRSVGLAGYNRDYDALEYGYHLLRGKKNPFLIILSDGQPASLYGVDGFSEDKDKPSFIKKLINKNKDIKTWGVGILDNSVAGIYPDFSVVGSINSLCPVVLDYFKKHIKRG